MVLEDGVAYLSAAAAAERLATTEMKILMLLRQKALCGRMLEGGWFVSEESVSSYQRQPVEAAAPPQCRTTCSGSGCGCR